MKRNITINIFGTLYHIDEDAYELLQKYNDNMRRYYGSREGGEEIADDVEHRVAELMSELQSQGVLAITIEHVKEIINRIGDPQEMDEGDINDSSAHAEASNETPSGAHTATGTQGEGPESSSTPDPGARKLFRDPEDKILGGVMSGISHYLGIKDPLLPRIIMVLLVLISFSTFAIVYLVAWVLIPEAVTPEDRLRMYGKPVSAKAINEEMMRGINRASQFVNDPQRRDTARGCFSAVAKFVLFCFGGFLLFILCTIMLGILATIFGITTAGITGGLELFDLPFEWSFDMMPKGLLIALITSALLIVGIPLFALTRLMFKSKDNSHMPTVAKVLLILLWVASIGVCIGSCIKTAAIAKEKIEKYEIEHFTRNGIYLPEHEWNFLDREGWNVEVLKDVKKYLRQYGSLPIGGGSYINLSAESPSTMVYNLNKESDLRPGTYKVDAYVRSDGEGNALYVVYNQGSDTLRVDIPPMEPTLKRDKTETNDDDDDDDDDDEDIYYQWTHVEGSFTVKQQETVKYGISNDKGFHNAPWNSSMVDIAKIKISSNK